MKGEMHYLDEDIAFAEANLREAEVMLEATWNSPESNSERKLFAAAVRVRKAEDALIAAIIASLNSDVPR